MADEPENTARPEAQVISLEIIRGEKEQAALAAEYRPMRLEDADAIVALDKQIALRKMELAALDQALRLLAIAAARGVGIDTENMAERWNLDVNTRRFTRMQ